MATRLPERGLDVLRAFAVLCVLVDHTIVAQTGETLALWTLGRVGVLLFFVHTSLVLMSSLERSADNPFNFYLRRAFRIYPLAITTVLFVAGLGLPAHVVPHDSLPVVVTVRTLIANLTLTTNLAGASDVVGPLWSLPLEVQMYAVLPFCFVIARRGVRPTITLIGVTCVLWLVQRTNVHLWRLNVLAFGPVFLLGVLAYARLRQFGPVPDFRESSFTRGAHVVAKYSYGIYLLHVPALGVAFVWGEALPVAVQWIAYTVLLLVLPFTAFHAIEKSGISWGKRLVHERQRSPVIASASA